MRNTPGMLVCCSPHFNGCVDSAELCVCSMVIEEQGAEVGLGTGC